MAEPVPKGQQPLKPHGKSRLRNEYYADSTDDEVVQVPNSDIMVEETQLEHNGDLPTFNPENDTQSDYGNDDGLYDATLIERLSVVQTTEQAPSSPKWSPLSRDSLCATQDTLPAISPHFTFGQPGNVTNRTSRNNLGLQPSQASFKSSSIVTIASGPQAKDDRYASRVSSNHLRAADSQELQRDDFVRPKTSEKRSREEHGDLGTSTTIHASCPEEWSVNLLEKQPAEPPSAQPPRPSQGTKKTRTAKKGKRPRNGVPVQQHGGPWPPRRNDESKDLSQTTYPAAPPGTTGHITPNQHREGPEGGAVRGYVGSLSNDEYPQEADLNTQQTSHALAGDLPNTQEQSNLIIDSVCQHKLQHEPFASPADVATSLRHSEIGSAEEGPLEVLAVGDQVASMTGDALQGDPMDPPQLDQPDRPSYLPGNLSGPDGHPAGPLQQSMSQPIAEPKANPRHSPPKLIDESVLHQVSAHGGSRRINKPQKKARPFRDITSHRPQTSALPSTIDNHLEALRVSFLAERLRKEHEQSTSAQRYEEMVATLNGRIDDQKQLIVEGKSRCEDLRSRLARLTEKAKTNQKYATGMQKDFEKLKKTVTVFQAQNTKTLQEKISEVQDERNTLCKELESALGSFDKLKRNMQKTIDDLCIRLQTSESKRRSHAETIGNQNALLRHERTKRDSLEKSLVASVQTIQHQLVESTSSMTTKLETLQTHAASASAVESQDSNVKECLLAVRALQSTPFLTKQDAQKAERMLRFLHERLDLVFKFESASGQSEGLISDEIQLFIKAQMEALKKDIVKYEEVVADNRTANEASIVVKTQLEAEQQHCARLNDQLKILQQAKGDLKGRTIQLECELRNLRNAAHEKTLHPLITEQELASLREQVRQTTNDMNLAKEKTLSTERLREEEEKQLAQLKTQYDGVVEELRRMAATEKQKPKPEDITKMRERIVNECRRESREKESSYKNEVHRLTLDRDEKEQVRQKMQNELSASKDQLHDLRKDHQTLIIKVDAVRKEKEKAETELKNLQETAAEPSGGDTSLTTMTEQLREKPDELSSMTRENALLQRQIGESTNKVSDLQASLDRLQTQVSEHSAAIQIVRSEAEDRVVEAQKRAKTAIEVAQGEASRLRLEKQAVVSELKLKRSREEHLEKHIAELTNERDDLQRQVAEHCDTRSAQDAETLRIATSADKEKQLLVDKHRAELASRDNRQAQIEAALKEAEARLRRKDDECQAKIKYEREKAESELAKVVEQYESHLSSKRREASSHEQTSSSMGQNDTPTRPKLKLNFGTTRKKVNRQGTLALGISNPSTEQHGQVLAVARNESSGRLRNSSDHFENLFEEPTTTRVPSSQADLDLVDPAAEFVPDNQDFGGPTMSMENFHDSLNQAALRELGPEKESSTDLSPMNSDVLDSLGRDVDGQSHFKHAKHDHSSGLHMRQISNRSENSSESGSRSSHNHERPKSQANTASRLMPPSATSPTNFLTRRIGETDMTRAGPVRRRINEPNSPEYMPPPLSRPIKKQTYGHRQSTQARPDQHSSDLLQEPGLEQGQKRKGSISHDGIQLKRPRLSSQQPAEDDSKKRLSYTQKTSNGGSSYRKRHESSQTSVPSSTASGSHARNASSSVAPRTPMQDATPRSHNRSRGQQYAPSSMRGSAPSYHVTRSKSRRHDTIDQRLDRELA